MKEGVRLFTIEPSADYIDFISPLTDHRPEEDNQTFKGNIRLITTKAIKMKSVTVKFIGESTVFQRSDQHEITTPILPKLKAKVQYKSTLLSIGEHLLPWEIDIPNIYPMSFQNKNAMIRYTIQIKISLGIKKSISAGRTIVIKRHRLPSQELAALVNTRTFENTIATKGFHYHVEIPKVICIEQGYLPISLKYDYIDHQQKKQLVKYISTQITQIEIYRTRSVSKIEADMAAIIPSGPRKGQASLLELFKMGDPGLVSRLLKPNQLVTVNEMDKNNEDYSSVPLLLKQDLDTSLSHALESPLVSIAHQLEMVFHFYNQQDDDVVRIKLPILISSVPDSDAGHSKRPIQKYTLETVLHKLPSSSVNTSEAKNIYTSHHTVKLKKSLSDQELKTIDEKHSSSYIRRSQYDADDTRSMDSFSIYSPTFSTFSSAELSSSPNKQGDSPFNTFTGLHPPPRRTKKTKSVSPQMKPLPYLPLPPIPPELNCSKSTTTTTMTLSPPLRNKRSNSIDMIPNKPIDKEKLLDISTYSSSMLSNPYMCAQLPPIPRPKMASPNTDHRLTRMYYDDESDEDE